jgi:ABC-2 type transport system ATP-binding protein
VIAAQVFEQDHVTEVKLHEDKGGLFVRTRDPNQFYRLLNQVILENELNIETVAPADEDVQSIYDYLIGEGRGNHS